MPSVAERITDVLIEQGVDTVFGIPGGAISRLFSELHKRGDIKVINAVHETNAVFMAIGHSLATGRPSVAIVTSGPGVTNAFTGLASAYADGIPVMLIGGEVSRAAFGRGALQEGSSHGFDAVAMARPITKVATQLARPTSAATQVRKAFVTMMSGKTGPAFVSLPLDIANADAGQQIHLGAPRLQFDIDRPACRKAGELLSQAKRPLILLGAGARGPSARGLVHELAHKTKSPVAVTPKGKSAFFEGDPLYLGVLGFGGHESVIKYLEQKPDVIVVMGSSLNDFSTNAWTPLLQASDTFVHVDIDCAQIGKNYPADIGIVGPLIDVVPEMLAGARVPPAVREPHPAFVTQEINQSATGQLTTAEVINALNEVTPRDAVFTSDMGEHLGVALHYLRTKTPGSFFTALGFGSMGSGVVSAIGLALGDPSRRAYAICGDGGFLMCGNEMQTAVKQHAPVTWVVINDGRFNMCHHGMRDQYGTKPDCTLSHVDFAAQARAFGAQGYVVNNAHELLAALDHRDGPVLVDVRIDPDMRLAGSQRVASLRQFSER